MANSSARTDGWQRLTGIVITVMCGSLFAVTLAATPPATATPAAAASATTPPTSAANNDPTAASPLANPFDGYADAAGAAAPASASASADVQVSQMQGSLTGAPGIWNTEFAETLGAGEASAGVYVQRYSRNPGGLVFTDADTGWTLGITKWLELSFGTTAYRRIRVTHPEQLTFGRLGNFGSYNPVAPFARNPLDDGPVDWNIGATIGLLSQDRGDKIGLAIQFDEHIPYDPDYGMGVNFYGVSTTEPTFIENVLVDKRMGAATIAFNAGYEHNGTADPGGIVYLPLRDQFTYSFGEIFPLLLPRLQGAVELYGNVPFGAGAITDVYGVPRPLDLNVGFRYSPIPWMGINAAYRFAGNSPETNASGFIFGLSFGPAPRKPAPPPPPPPPPTLSCNVDNSTVQPGATVHITSTVAPQGLPYTYSWTTTGGKLTQTDGSATLDTTGLAPGMYTVTGRVNNGSGGTNDCNASVEVREPVRNPPTASCAVNPTTPVNPGAPLTFSGQASSPDQRPLTYAWQVSPASAGHLDTTSQPTVHLDTTGANPGSVNATLTVTDDRGLSATCSAQGTIEAPPPPPQAALATTLQFKPNSSRVDNAAKAALDDVALRLQQDASARAVIVGFATSTELGGHHRALSAAATLKLAEERAVNAKAYLVTEKGISADRVEVRHDDGPQKAEVWVVPQGANYAGSGQTFDENDVKAAPVRRRGHSK